MKIKDWLPLVDLYDNVSELLLEAKSVTVANEIKELEAIACGDENTNSYTVSYDLPDGKKVDEVDVVRVRNGVSANYREAYMRRRDPDCMIVADSKPSDKARFTDRFDYDFYSLKNETFEWLKSQDLAVFAFEMGQRGYGADAIAICPMNAGFFAFGLGLLQGIVDVRKLGRDFIPKSIIYVAPPFRHTHFDGKQIVVHDRSEIHEIYSYNLYPGPSAKKGVYGALIELGEQEGWVTAHCSAVEVVTPYDNVISFMHEGASGGGKSEMLQQPHRLADGRLLVGQNTVTGEKIHVEIPRTCDLHPVCDDMGLCHPNFQQKKGKLFLMDAESAWFLRVDHISDYGTDPDLEHLTIKSEQSQLFLNIDAALGSTALIWEHIEDSPGKPCPNPRVIVSRNAIPNAIERPVQVDIRSFGVRTPPCSKENPSYGIMGMLHVLPPALAWLWRLVAPRGYANPSIVDKGEMSSEGVGSYWPFTTGKKVAQANLLLKQFQHASLSRYVLIPNQHIGAWKTGFMPQWLVRDYLARRGNAKFNPNQITPSKSSLLGFSLESMRIEGAQIPKELLQVDLQDEVGEEAFMAGNQFLVDFFHETLQKYLKPGLDKLGRDIIECCLDNGTVEDYRNFIAETDI